MVQKEMEHFGRSGGEGWGEKGGLIHHKMHTLKVFQSQQQPTIVSG